MHSSKIKDKRGKQYINNGYLALLLDKVNTKRIRSNIPIGNVK